MEEYKRDIVIDSNGDITVTEPPMYAQEYDLTFVGNKLVSAVPTSQNREKLTTSTLFSAIGLAALGLFAFIKFGIGEGLLFVALGACSLYYNDKPIN